MGSKLPVIRASDASGGDAAYRRRRRTLFFCAFLAAALLHLGCGEAPPLAELARARSDVERAVKQESGAYAPEELAQAQQAMREAERAVTVQSARFAVRRDYGPARAMLERARFYAVQAARMAQARRDQTRSAAESEISRLEDSLSRAREIKRFLAPRDPAIHRLVVAAEIEEDLAEKRMAEKNFTGALEAARSGAGRVQTVEQLLLSSMVRFTSHPDLSSWRNWVDEAVRRSRVRGSVAFVVDKLRRKMTVYRSGRTIRTLTVDLGISGMERKLRSGDDATPEGLYKIEQIRSPGQTRYHRAFLLDYPNEQDRRRFAEAKRKGLIPRGAGPGDLIEIHGEGGRDKDWTRGCVALTNQEMDELSGMVSVGTTVAIVGYNPRDEDNPW